jgi:hypothetical protein
MFRADYDRTRLPASQRGYGHTWRQLRLLILRDKPMCQWPFCNQPATDVDHILPLRAGGENTRQNLQSLCKPHHAQKTAREDGGWGRATQAPAGQSCVTLVCGPPGSGKTTFVTARAAWGDLIIDLDTLFQALSGLPLYDKPEGLLPFALAARAALYSRLDRAAVRAWVITGGASAAERQQLRLRWNAEIIVLEVGPTTCIQRIGADPRRSARRDLWQPLVTQWWREYAPDPRDTRLGEGGSKSLRPPGEDRSP